MTALAPSPELVLRPNARPATLQRYRLSSTPQDFLKRNRPFQCNSTQARPAATFVINFFLLNCIFTRRASHRQISSGRQNRQALSVFHLGANQPFPRDRICKDLRNPRQQHVDTAAGSGYGDASFAQKGAEAQCLWFVLICFQLLLGPSMLTILVRLRFRLANRQTYEPRQQIKKASEVRATGPPGVNWWPCCSQRGG